MNRETKRSDEGVYLLLHTNLTTIDLNDNEVMNDTNDFEGDNSGKDNNVNSNSEIGTGAEIEKDKIDKDKKEEKKIETIHNKLLEIINKKENEKSNENNTLKNYNDILNVINSEKRKSSLSASITHGNSIAGIKKDINTKQNSLENYFICPDGFTIGFIVDAKQWIEDDYIIVPAELVYINKKEKKVLYPYENQNKAYNCQLLKSETPVKVVGKIKNTTVLWIA